MNDISRKLWVLVLTAFMLSLGGSAMAAGTNRVQPVSKHRITITYPVDVPGAGRHLTEWLAAAHFDIAGVREKFAQVEVIATDGGLAFLRKNSVEFKVIESRFGYEAGPDPRYLNPDTLAQKMKDLADAYPHVTRLEEIGRSLEGRPILALLVSSTPRKNDPASYAKPTILFDGMHHAREIMTPEVVLDVAESLLKASYAGAAGSRRLIQDWNIWVVPMLNVDGNHIVWTGDSWWRKNARADGASIFGVDINRNYPFEWNKCGGSSGSHGAQDYHGTAAASEPETQALISLAEAIRPTASLSYHSSGEFVIYPFGCEGEYSSERALMSKYAHDLAASLPSEAGYTGTGTYREGTVWEIMYPVDGASADFMHAEFGAMAFVLEINLEFQPPYADREPTVQKHRVGWRRLIERMTQNLLTVQVNGADPTATTVDIFPIEHKHGEKPFRVNDGGYFFKTLDPGVYRVVATTTGGRRTEARVEMKGAPARVSLAF